MSEIPKIFAQPWADYELLDAGGGKKLDNYLDMLSGVKEGGPSSYGDDSKWRLK